MKLLESILLAVDFTEKDNSSLVETAAELAGVFNSQIFVVNVIPDKSGDKHVKDYMQNVADETVKEVAETLEKRGVRRIKSKILKGNPFEELLSFADKGNFNVILAGSGKESVKNIRPGVTVRKLIRKSSVPVWVIRPETKGFNNILCPVDFSEASHRALTNAILLASKMRIGLKVVSVFEPIEIVSRRISTNLDEYNESSYNNYSRQLDDFLVGFDFLGINYEKEVLSGKPEEMIVEELKKNKFDLLLMGTTGKTELSRILIGSVTEKVIEAAPVSIITTKKQNILNPEFEMRIAQMESLIKQADKQMKDKNFEEAVALYEKCLSLDDLFLPAMIGASKAYGKLGNKDRAEKHKEYADEIIERLWNKKTIKEFIQ